MDYGAELKNQDASVAYCVDSIAAMVPAREMNQRQRDYIMGLLKMGHWQMNSATAWGEVTLLDTRQKLRELQLALADKKSYTENSSDWMPSTPKEAAREIDKLRLVEKRWADKIHEAKSGGYFYSVIPYLEYLKQPKEVRAESDISYLLPNLLQRALLELQSCPLVESASSTKPQFSKKKNWLNRLGIAISIASIVTAAFEIYQKWATGLWYIPFS